MMRLVTLACVLWGAVLEARAQEVPGCGNLKNAYGPFDYRDPAMRQQNLPIVEEFHFTNDVRMLVRGSTGSLVGDLDYVLRAFPNHPGALQAMGRYSLRGGKFPMDARIPSAECYFERAVAFAPADATVRGIYGAYLAKRGDRKGARRQYEESLRLAPESGEVNYNAGLFFLQEGDLARAKALAKVAYDSGYPLPGLRELIAQAEASHGVPPPGPAPKW